MQERKQRKCSLGKKVRDFSQVQNGSNKRKKIFFFFFLIIIAENSVGSVWADTLTGCGAELSGSLASRGCALRKCVRPKKNVTLTMRSDVK